MSIAGHKVGAGLRTLPSWFQRFCQRPMVKFIVAWRAPGANPKRWIVSLHGSRGFATDDLAIWYPSLKGRDVGLISVQWWIGADNSPRSYYAPLQIYRESHPNLS